MSENSGEALAIYQKARRYVLAVLIAVLLVALLFGQSMFAPETVMHEVIEMIGIVLIILGIAGRLWSTLYIGGRKSAEVVSEGPYSVTRNPLYLFSSLAAAGVGAQMGSITVALGFAVICAIAFHIVILREERYLSAKLGADYQAYLLRVPRFFPKPSLYHEGKPQGFQAKRLLSTLLDGLVFLVAMPFFEVIEVAQTSGTLPVLFKMP